MAKHDTAKAFLKGLTSADLAILSKWFAQEKPQGFSFLAWVEQGLHSGSVNKTVLRDKSKQSNISRQWHRSRYQELRDTANRGVMLSPAQESELDILENTVHGFTAGQRGKWLSPVEDAAATVAGISPIPPMSPTVPSPTELLSPATASSIHPKSSANVTNKPEVRPPQPLPIPTTKAGKEPSIPVAPTILLRMDRGGSVPPEKSTTSAKGTTATTLMPFSGGVKSIPPPSFQSPSPARGALPQSPNLPAFKINLGVSEPTPQPLGTDTIPAMLSPKEFVVNAKDAEKYRPLLEKINKEHGGKGSKPASLAQGGSVYLARGGRAYDDPGLDDDPATRRRKARRGLSRALTMKTRYRHIEIPRAVSEHAAAVNRRWAAVSKVASLRAAGQPVDMAKRIAAKARQEEAEAMEKLILATQKAKEIEEDLTKARKQQAEATSTIPTHLRTAGMAASAAGIGATALGATGAAQHFDTIAALLAQARLPGLRGTKAKAGLIGQSVGHLGAALNPMGLMQPHGPAGTMQAAGGAISSMGMALGPTPAGPALMMLGGLATAAGKAVEGLQGLTQQLHDSNMRFAEFSASMSVVQAKQELREFALGMQRGERLAPSAEGAAQAKFKTDRILAKMEDHLNIMRNRMVEGLINAIEPHVVGHATAWELGFMNWSSWIGSFAEGLGIKWLGKAIDKYLHDVNKPDTGLTGDMIKDAFNTFGLDQPIDGPGGRPEGFGR